MFQAGVAFLQKLQSLLAIFSYSYFVQLAIYPLWLESSSVGTTESLHSPSRCSVVKTLEDYPDDLYFPRGQAHSYYRELLLPRPMFFDWYIKAQAIGVAFRGQMILFDNMGPQIGRVDVEQPVLVCKYSCANQLGGLNSLCVLKILAEKESCSTAQPTWYRRPLCSLMTDSIEQSGFMGWPVLPSEHVIGSSWYDDSLLVMTRMAFEAALAVVSLEIFFPFCLQCLRKVKRRGAFDQRFKSSLATSGVRMHACEVLNLLHVLVLIILEIQKSVGGVIS